MKTHSHFAARVICCLAIASAYPAGFGTASEKKYGNLGVCSQPSQSCDSRQKKFAPYELGFRLPSSLKANAIYESALFYAVILRTDSSPSCDGGEFTRKTETLRRETQKYFSNRKVFADHQCPDMGAVFYSETNKAGQNTRALQGSFIAVYAGQTEAEAQRVLKAAKPRFSRATVRRLRVGYTRVVQ